MHSQKFIGKMTGRNKRITKNSTKKTTKNTETVKRHETQDASQEHQGLTGNDWNTGVVAKASKAQFHESNKENETNNNHLTENGSSRKRKFEMTVKSSAVSVVENSHRSQTNAALPAVDVSHSFVATSTHTATAMNGATGDCDLSTGAYAHNIENISEVVTSNSVHITHSKKRRLSTLAGTNIDPSSRIFITEATLVTESEAVVTKRVTKSRRLLSVPSKPQRRMKKISSNSDNHVSIIPNGGHTSDSEDKSECTDNGAFNNNISGTHAQPSTSQAGQQGINQNKIQANGSESTPESPHDYIKFDQNAILANSTMISPVETLDEEATVARSDKQIAVAAKKVTKRTQKATVETKPKEVVQNADDCATTSSTGSLRRSTRKRTVSALYLYGSMGIYEMAIEREKQRKVKQVPARVQEPRSAMRTEKTTYNSRDLDWFNDLCDPNMSLKDQGKNNESHSRNLLSSQIDCTSFGQIHYVLDGKISYGYFPTTNNQLYGVMRFPKGAVTATKSSKNNVVMEVLNGLFEVRQNRKTIKVKPGALIIKPGTSYSIKYLESAIGVILFQHYSTLENAENE